MPASFVPSGPAANLHREKAACAEAALQALQASNAARLAAVPHIDRTVNVTRRITLIGLLVAIIILAVQFIGLPLFADSDVATSYRVEVAQQQSAQRLGGIRNGNRVRNAWVS